MLVIRRPHWADAQNIRDNSLVCCGCLLLSLEMLTTT